MTNNHLQIISPLEQAQDEVWEALALFRGAQRAHDPNAPIFQDHLRWMQRRFVTLTNARLNAHLN